MRARSTLIAAAATAALLVSCGSGSSSDGAADPSTTTAPATTTSTGATSTTATPTDARGQLEQRLGAELEDPASAAAIVGAMDDTAVSAAEDLADGDIAGSPWLAYQLTPVLADEIDSLWVFSFGYRFRDGSTAPAVPLGGTPPPMDQLVPGPTNEALAQAAADFVEDHPVPIVAQWEVAQVLEEMGVEDVISVEPDIAADGTVTYLSTTGVAEKGLGLLADEGIEPGHAGVLCFADHAVRCVLSAEDAGLTADAPAGVLLPLDYDPESGQEWTRSRETWIPIDLAGRAALKG